MTLIKFRNPVPRAEITAGLRHLADYLDAHPGIPVPPYGWELLVSTHDDTDPDGIASVDRIAAILGVAVDDQTSDGGLYRADKTFGPIAYRAFHIPASMRENHAGPSSAADDDAVAAAR